MIMMTVRMYDAKNRLLFGSNRPLRITYESTPLRYIRIATFLPLYVIGFWKESEAQQVVLFEDLVAGADEDSIWRIEAEISEKRFEVYSCHLRFDANMSGLAWMVKHHFYSSSAVILSGLLLFQLFIFFLFIGSKLSFKVIATLFHAVTDAHLRYVLRRTTSDREPASAVFGGSMLDVPEQGLDSPTPVPDSESTSSVDADSPLANVPSNPFVRASSRSAVRSAPATTPSSAHAPAANNHDHTDGDDDDDDDDGTEEDDDASDDERESHISRPGIRQRIVASSTGSRHNSPLRPSSM
eukprot:ANDGO_07636.mRNA.1 hypothetical protein